MDMELFLVFGAGVVVGAFLRGNPKVEVNVDVNNGDSTEEFEKTPPKVSSFSDGQWTNITATFDKAAESMKMAEEVIKNAKAK
jgi:hypothetical protein